VSTRTQVVFLGPSLARNEAQQVLPDAIYLPPAAMGDIVGALRRYRPHAIGLIDGTFLQNMSVFHKELLYAMDNGAYVLRSSSMGALRAAECAPLRNDRHRRDLQRASLRVKWKKNTEVALNHADAKAELPSSIRRDGHHPPLFCAARRPLVLIPDLAIATSSSPAQNKTWFSKTQCANFFAETL
jgi:Uncharacterized conserved protein